MEKKHSKVGCVYVLTSVNTEYIKIGGTGFAPMKRVKEINASHPYKELGPWEIHDFRQVTDWRLVERGMHYVFRSSFAHAVSGQKELFALAPATASKHLAELDESILLRKPKLDRMFQEDGFSVFLSELFAVTGLLNWLDIQGAWVLTLFPSTNGGRYYTLSIGSHEVAFSTLARAGEPSVHMLHMDWLIFDFEEVVDWVEEHEGCLVKNNYLSGLSRSVSVFFEGSFDDVLRFLGLDGVRRAMIAYWTEALIKLKEQSKVSVFSRHHHWNAVAELKRRMEQGQHF